MAEVSIEVIKNGPYIVKGEVEITDADGNRYPVEKRMAPVPLRRFHRKPFATGPIQRLASKPPRKPSPNQRKKNPRLRAAGDSGRR